MRNTEELRSIPVPTHEHDATNLDLPSRREVMARLANMGLFLASPDFQTAKKVERPSGVTNWKEVHALDEGLIDKIDKNQPIALLIGSVWCEPCKSAAKWWTTRSIGPFEPYELIARTPDEWKNMKYHGLATQIKDRDAAPLMLMIRGQSGQKYRHETVLKHAFGYDGCTDGIAQWLNEQGF